MLASIVYLLVALIWPYSKTTTDSSKLLLIHPAGFVLPLVVAIPFYERRLERGIFQHLGHNTGHMTPAYGSEPVSLMAKWLLVLYDFPRRHNISRLYAGNHWLFDKYHKEG
ncbi:MAG TPA: hypothetical protein VNI53_07980 [Gammaproteobacteria bacterium]|nr:hypothetical protein [Gammaproteobacteria bacterium]